MDWCSSRGRTVDVTRARVAAVVGLSFLALGMGAGAEAMVGQGALDRLTMRDAEVDPRVVVVTFPSGLGGSSLEVPHLRATFSRDIAVLALRGGASGVGFVDFDSLSFSDGGAGRANVIGSDELQRAGVGVLHDVALVAADDTIPFLAGYRVDPLASELAGLGVDTGGSAARTVPALVRVADLTDGLIVDSPAFAFDAVDRTSTTIVPGFALRLAEFATSAELTEPSPDAVRLGELRIPLEDGRLRVAWSGELDDVDDVRIVDASDLIDGVPDDLFRDAVVLVGTVDPSKTEYVTTPVGDLPEVLVQANALNTVLRASWVHPGPLVVPWTAAVFGVGAVVIAGGVGTARRRTWPLFAIAAATVVCWTVASAVAARSGTLVPVVLPTVAVSSIAAMVASVGQAETVAERRRLRALFSQYVPASVAEQLIASGRGTQASTGERVALTALFCDLRGFTPLAARLTPPEVRELLNLYYEHLARVVFDDRGTVLQYTGDEIFAVFGAPLPDADHATHALRCARHMFERQAALNDDLLRRGLPPLNYGIGLHSGDAVAAHVGSSVRMQYAVIGDTINVASRHRALARGGQIVLSDVTKTLIGDIADAEQLEHVAMPGVADARSVFLIQAGPPTPSGDPSLVRPPDG